MDMQHVQYMNMQSERGHAAWIRAYSTDIDMDFVIDMHMDVDIVTCIYQRNIFNGSNGQFIRTFIQFR